MRPGSLRRNKASEVIKVFAIISVCLAPQYLTCEPMRPVPYDSATDCQADVKNVIRYYLRQFQELGPSVRVMVMCRPRIMRPK